MATPVRNPELQQLLAGLDDGTFGLDGPATKRTHLTDTHIGGTQTQIAPRSNSKYDHESSHDRVEPITTPDGSNRARSSTPLATSHAPDTSRITTWPAALKYVTKYIATDEQAISRIRNIISEQHKHEKQWWAQREALIAQQQRRDGSQAQAAELLRSLGGASVPVVSASAEDQEAELKTFDLKVYNSLMQMAQHFENQLKTLAVPFFAIKTELISDEDLKDNGSTADRRLSKLTLRTLQKMMLQTLEDLLTGE